MSLSAPIRSTLSVLFVCAGCESSLPRPCHEDAECSNAEVCFVNGCGDPGVGLAVEVTPSSSSGLATEDFILGSSTGTQDLSLSGPTALQGALKRDAPPASGEPMAYTSPVSFRVNGRSAVIPSVPRHFQTSLLATEGSYVLPVSSGLYTVIVEPEDPSVPPFVEQNVRVSAGSKLRLDVAFAPATEILKVQGSILGSSLPVTSAVLEVQAVTTADRLPVSQKSPVSASGEFALFIDPSVHSSGSYAIQVGPRDASGIVPRKSFTVPVAPSLPSSLLLGEFGAPITLSGQVLDDAAEPIKDATVYVEGTAAGGGSFSSARLRTGEDGRFSLQTLPALAGSALTLAAVPPANAAVGTVRVVLSPNAIDLRLVCPRRLVVQGRLMRPEGTPAIDVAVEAEAVAAANAGEAALPPGATGRTDADGHFELSLEAGRYRLDFEPFDLPRMSRFITVSDAASANLDELILSKGKRFTGTITQGDTEPVRAAGFALVRVFRVLQSENGEPSAVLLDETFTDANGRYSVLLPTR